MGILTSGGDGFRGTIPRNAMKTPALPPSRPSPARTVLALIFLPILLLTLLPDRVAADSENTYPRNGEIVGKTPRSIRVPGTGKVEITLKNDQGVMIPFTGETLVNDGTVTVQPPALVYGTYIVTWSSADGDGWFSFSVGEPSATVTAGTFNVYLAVLVAAILLAAAAAGVVGRAKKNKKMYLGSIPLLLTAVTGALLVSRTDSEYSLKKLDSSIEPAQECLKSSNRLNVERCLVGSYVSLAYASSPAEASRTLEKDMQTNPMLRYYCHHTTHAIGRAGYAIYGSVAEAFTKGVEVCDFGYYHGIIEEASGYQTDESFQDSIPTLCGDLTTNDLFYMQCIHGIGHAVAQRTNNDMLRGLTMCERLDVLPKEELAAALNACGTGVTMEWFSVATSGSEGLNAVSPTVSSPRDVCPMVSDRWAGECYEYVGNTVDSSKPYESLSELAGWCTGTPQPVSCYIGIARAGVGLGVSPKDILSICRTSGEAEPRNQCIEWYIVGKATTIDFSLESVERSCAEMSGYPEIGAICARAKDKVAQIEKNVALTGGA